MAEAGEQAGEGQGARDAGQAAGDHRHRVAEGGSDHAGVQVAEARAAVTTAICRPDSRPSSPAGTDSWTIVVRNTAEITSAQPATASRARPAARAAPAGRPSQGGARSARSR